MSSEEKRPVTLLEHLNQAYEGRVQIQRLHDLLLSESSWQFIHNTKLVSEYTVQHKREGCELCDLIDRIWRIVGDYQNLVQGFFAAAEETARQAARARGEEELAVQITAETREYLASRPEFKALA